MKLNEFGQAIGDPVPDWSPRAWPTRNVLEGRYCQVLPLSVDRDAAALHTAFSAEPEGKLWTYLPYGPFGDEQQYIAWLKQNATGDDPLFYSIASKSGTPIGVASYLRIEARVGVIEVGHLCFSQALMHTRMATEAMYLMMRLVFDDLGYRRYEWKCDALNAPSRSAALRLGFRFEGIFRNATVYKERSRDTAWFSVIDTDWPELRAAFEAWLMPSNFDETGAQRQRLGEFRRE